jgi:hypothetical protein
LRMVSILPMPIIPVPRVTGVTAEHHASSAQTDKIARVPAAATKS